MEKKSVFETLSAINVKPYVKEKNKLSYLSWATAWKLLKEVYPDAQRIIYENDHTGFNYWTDGKSCWVRVGIIVDGHEHQDMLPVMDFRNKSISADLVNSMDINKTIQRATAKAIAMHGLGLALYTGEDLPDEVVTPAPKKLLKLDLDDENWSNVLNYIVSNKDKGLDHIIGQLERKYKVKATLKKEISNIISE
jgi:hypothetical protein